MVTDRHLDLSKLVGFQSVLYQGAKVKTSTPKMEYRPWDERNDHIGQAAQSTPVQTEYEDRSALLRNWGEDEWKRESILVFPCSRVLEGNKRT